MNKSRLLSSALVLSASIVSAACSAVDEDPVLDVSEADRGSYEIYLSGPEESRQSVPVEGTSIYLESSYRDLGGGPRGEVSMSSYREQGVSVWVDAYIDVLCTDGSWAYAGGGGWYLQYSGYLHMTDTSCQSPYSVSEAWGHIHIDY
jgi:hypothetical protein